ncbi:UDP-N-acetylmuramoyl-L-alanine--D-glutamate ligase [Elusimicrobiota bacterium]
MKNKSLKGLNITVLGFGRSGVAAAKLVFKLGAQVLISDSLHKKREGVNANIKTEFGGHSDKVLRSDLIIKSPGIPNNIPILKKARKNKIPVIGEMGFVLNHTNPKKVIAVTGTNGKTTTTTLLGKMFKDAAIKNVVAGNIGLPLSSLTEKIDKKTNAILEVSSYQLEDSPKFNPNICAILNITPDHLDHHCSMENYIKAKKKIFTNQRKNDFCILNYDDSKCRELARYCPSKVIFFSTKKELKKGIYYKNGSFVIRIAKFHIRFQAKLKVPGMHNIENILAATAMAIVSGIPINSIKKTIQLFKGIEHRIEYVAEINGIKYFNDSKATNVDSTRVALESFPGSIWLILGGKDKGSSYRVLQKLIKEKVKGVLLVGEAAKKIKKDLFGVVDMYDCRTINNAVKKSLYIAEKGDIVLLSPACASFDQFKDYEERGRQFKKSVDGL